MALENINSSSNSSSNSDSKNTDIKSVTVHENDKYQTTTDIGNLSTATIERVYQYNTQDLLDEFGDIE